MDPARMFKESLTSRPELENSQGQNAKHSNGANVFRYTLELRRCSERLACQRGATPDLCPFTQLPYRPSRRAQEVRKASAARLS